jgi:hypothetical protein
MTNPTPGPSFKGQRFIEAGKRAAADRITATPFEGRYIYDTQQHNPSAPVPPDERPNDSLQTMDARTWAAEFMKITGGAADESTMLAWFANALMCGWDHHYWQSDEYKREVARFLGGDTIATPPQPPGAPVPPDDLKAEWLKTPTPGPVFCMDAPLDAAAAWGYAQAIPEREKLAALLTKAHDSLRHCGYNTHPQVGQSLLALAAECHAATERLGGGES